MFIRTAFAAGLAAAGTRCISVAVAAASAAYTEFGIIRTVEAGFAAFGADHFAAVFAIEALAAEVFGFAFAAVFMAAGADCVAVAFAAASACLAEFVLVRTVVTLIAAFRADIRAVITKQAIAALIICVAFAAGFAAAGPVRVYPLCRFS